MKTRLYLLSASAIAFGTLSLSVGVFAQQVTGDSLIQQSLSKLAQVHNLQANFVETDTYSGKYRDLLQKGTISLQRPGQLDAFIQRFRQVSTSDPWQPSGNDTKAVSDGQTYTFAFLHPNSTQITQSPASGRVLTKALASFPQLEGFFNGQATLPGQQGSATLLPSETWEGQSYQVVQYTVVQKGDDGQGDSAKAYIGSDLLIHRLIYSEVRDDGTETQEWALRNVVVDGTPNPSEFVYNPPKDALPLADRSGRESLLEDGTIAPDFTVFDRSGKPVHLSDYRGKTVVLDFWATWCWPCNQSLPYTAATIRNAADSNVVALAVAINDSKKGFDAWLGKHNYPELKFLYDPTTYGPNDITTLYHIKTQPIAYVIAPDGKIVSSINGFTGPNDRLELALKAVPPVITADAR